MVELLSSRYWLPASPIITFPLHWQERPGLSFLICFAMKIPDMVFSVFHPKGIKSVVRAKLKQGDRRDLFQ